MVLPPTLLGYCLLIAIGRLSFAGQLYHRLFGADLSFSLAGRRGRPHRSHRRRQLAIPAAVALADVDRDIIDCARVYGASELTIFWKISLPMARGRESPPALADD